MSGRESVNWRGLRLRERRSGESVHINKFVRVQQHAAEGEEAVAADELGGSGEFLPRGRAGEGEVEGAGDLSDGVRAGFPFEAAGEVAGLLEDELVVREREGLQRSGGGGARGVRFAGFGQSSVVINVCGVVRTTKR